MYTNAINRSAAARILFVPHRHICKLVKFAHVVLVVVKGQRPQFVTKTAFEDDWLNIRLKKAESCTVIPRQGRPDFLVQSSESGVPHLVHLGADASCHHCDCGDYKNQIENNPHIGLCCHIIAAQQYQRQHQHVILVKPSVNLNEFHKQLTIVNGLSID